MRTPPDDDALLPALILFLFTAMFTGALLLMMYVAGERIHFVPPSSTLAPLVP